MPLHKDGIIEIVIGPAVVSSGPAAVLSAEDAVKSLLQFFSIEPRDCVNKSEIPYRAG
jgi:hypothetical protein